MPTAATITLPWPPSVNDYWRHRVIGKIAIVYVSSQGKMYREAVRQAVVRRWPGLLKPLECRLHVIVTVNAPTRRARDLDNLGKALLDGLTHAGVYADDSQIDHLEFVRSSNIGKPGSVDVMIQPAAKGS